MFISLLTAYEHVLRVKVCSLYNITIIKLDDLLCTHINNMLSFDCSADNIKFSSYISFLYLHCIHIHKSYQTIQEAYNDVNHVVKSIDSFLNATLRFSSCVPIYLTIPGEYNNELYLTQTEELNLLHIVFTDSFLLSRNFNLTLIKALPIIFIK